MKGVGVVGRSGGSPHPARSGQDGRFQSAWI